MPNDIRSFFGGKPTGTLAPPKEEAPKAKGRAKKARVVEDSADDEPAPVKAKTPTKATRKAKQVESPKGTATSTSDYFGSTNKPKRSAPSKSKGVPEVTITPKKATPVKTPAKSAPISTGTPIRTKASNGTNVKLEDDVDNDDDIYKSSYKANGKKDDYEEDSGEDMVIAQPKRATATRGRKSKIVKDEDEDVDMTDLKDDDSDEFVVSDEHEDVKPKKRTSKAPTSKKRKSLDEDDESGADVPVKKGRGTKASAPTKSPAKKKPKTTAKDTAEDASTSSIFNSISQIRAPTPPPRGENGKFNPSAIVANQTAHASMSSSLEIPTGAENCLAGLKFVFTGVLGSLDRDTGQNLVKQYGGKCQPSASKTTDFVVLGADAGPKKLEVIRDNKLKTIDEFGLMELIKKMPANGGSGKAAAAFEKKKDAEAAKIQKLADEMKAQEDQAAKTAASLAKNASSSKSGPPVKTAVDPNNQLWTVKYAPTAINQICGNKGHVEKLQQWLRDFPKYKRKNFKLAGKDGMGVYRAVMIHGPPGIGKTTAAHVVAKVEGYDVVESNASDTRSKRLVEEGLKGILNTTSLLGYFSGQGKAVEDSKKKLVLIMDEVDGMSAGDRGGVGALAKVCRTTEIPIILICNDRKLQKMKPFDHVTFDMPFRRPTADMIRGRMLTIAYREKLQIPPPVLNALIEGSNADIRQIVNMISTAKLDQEAMSFDKGKSMSKAWEKHVVLKPWDIVGKILGGHMFAETSKATLNDKSELYFNDHEFSYLMLQENYLGTTPSVLGGYQGKERSLKALELASNAADAISDGDLVDRMIHGSQQQWSLMPTHAIFSFVRPASYVSGSLAGYGQVRFTSWLGQNSKQGKLSRFVKEVQGHMRLRTTGDRHEIRQQYLPSLWNSLVNRLQIEGKEAVPTIIDLMDSYFLTRDDFDAIMELGIGKMDMDKVKIDSQAKATFTRMYNAASHPMPFIKASAVIAPAKTAKERPDLEEAIEDSDEGEPEVAEVVEDEEDAINLKKEKYITAPKKKKAPAANTKEKKSKKGDADVDMDEQEEAIPKKGKGKAKAKK